MTNNNVLNRLYGLSFSVNFFEKGSIEVTEDDVDRFHDEYQDILNQLNLSWQKNRSTENKKVPEQRSDYALRDRAFE